MKTPAQRQEGTRPEFPPGAGPPALVRTAAGPREVTAAKMTRARREPALGRITALAQSGAMYGAIMGGVAGAVLGGVGAAIRGPIPRAPVVAAFGILVMACAGVIYGALSGGVGGALAGILRVWRGDGRRD